MNAELPRVVLSIVCLTLTLAGSAAACVAPVETPALREGIVDWINDARGANGLPPLRRSMMLQESATAHACDMAERGYFAHEGPGGPSFAQRLKSAGYLFRAANENIARTEATAIDVPTRLWRDSSLHWANVLNPDVRDVGVGIAEAGGQIIWVTNAGRD